MTTSGESTSPGPGRPAPAQAQEGHQKPDTGGTSSRLSARGEALSALLPEVLAEFTTDVSADLDEVVCRVASAGVAEVAEILKNDPRVSFKFIRLLTVVDYIEPDGELEVVYHLQSLENRFKMALKTRVKESAPGVPTVTTVWRGADWFEREMHDLFGVVFEGHPDPRTLILPDNFEGYPGRKSYPLHDYDQW